MAQVLCRKIKTNYAIPQMTVVVGSTLTALGKNFIMKTEGAKISINSSVLAPYDYNETTVIDATYTYKFDKDVVITIFDEVTI